MDSLLTFAEELERRDADVAEALDRVERRRAEVDELRTHGAAVASFLAALPDALAAREADERAAADERTRADASVRDAETAVERARKENERIEAERVLQDARDAVQAADAWIAQTRAAREQLLREAEAERREAERLTARAGELSGTAHDFEGALEWASRERGALLLEHSKLVSEREKVVREASELLGSILGEPLTATAVAGVRDRIERALRETSA
jgi:chromosome segregation ATPase